MPEKPYRVQIPLNKTKKQVINIQEPERKSMYDNLVENLKIAKFKTFLHRVIYLGGHTMTEEDALEYFSDSVKKVNITGSIEILTGFLLHYPCYFIHIVEGDEDSIAKHLRYVLKGNQAKFLRNVSLLVDLCHINQRITTEWSSYSGFPKNLLNPIDNTNAADIAHLVFTCVLKMYQLVSQITEDSNKSHHSDLVSEISTVRTRFEQSSFQATSMASILFSQLCPYRNILPEFELVEFLVNTPNTLDINLYYQKLITVVNVNLYKELIWPIPSEMIPYDVFTTVYDRDLDMPKSDKDKQKEKKRHTDENDDTSLVEENEGGSFIK